MSAGYTLTWAGAALAMQIRRNCVDAIDETMAECVTTAKDRVRVASGTLQGSIRFEPATMTGLGAEGKWGSFDVGYAIYQELGTYKMTAQPYLRPAADMHYPALAKRIAI
jgi:hypothetical protein